ncbi:hypothetical protein APA66_24435 [Pseudomonas aeruginosa]|uniref:hypothetical protein n=1 Tax=Pseudomonas aeruginosa TaxID=287 RepID=UPI0005B42275|nr:hypothetical protein [Pseudomonas aeruginosa]ELP9624166.1 hypothetical protein [Pseudomonas aeruginosa]ELQ6360416.1 hypothetical protein [Pseudomonas aeruginosa]KSM48474.1 hypothetical protein APA66_24435 [Pseudomonas aeruginosa]OWI61940.1 hypothetical protein CDC23_17955 [Pseudomonas aeruginosa]OWI63625.1 hypothetical protein CDC24_07780 [Pseudomonas aeruginosa]
MTIVTVTVVPASELPEHIEGMNKATAEWTDRAARGECGWICSDCCCSDPKGMPDECFHGHASCTAIIKRDKMRAMRAGSEPQ